MSSGEVLYQLKETAKWSRDPQEKKIAIKELTAFGERALPSLQEILSVSAYEEVKSACTDAIKAINKGYDPTRTSSSTEVLKKTKGEDQEEQDQNVTEVSKLADLPP